MQKIVIRIGDFLIIITIVLVLLVVMVALTRHENLLEIARFTLVLSVAAIIHPAPGLGVINEAVKQSRITFARMRSYATSRIAETIRITLFMTLSIVVFNFYPITAMMIILLALLNGLPIPAIACDNARVSQRPVRWNMQGLLAVSSLLCISGVLASFLVFFLLREAGFSEPMIQSMLFLELIVAGRSTLYITRAGGWFWQRAWPAPLLFVATFHTEILGTLIAVYGFMITPVGWEYALWMWVYAVAWFMVRMLACRVLRARDEVEDSIAHDFIQVCVSLAHALFRENLIACKTMYSDGNAFVTGDVRSCRLCSC